MDNTCQPKLNVIYCDDIRQEVGDKISLMGIYTGDIIFDQLPSVLPKFSLLATFSLDLSDELPEWFEVKVLAGKNNIPIASSGKVDGKNQAFTTRFDDDLGIPYTTKMINLVLMISPLVVQEETHLKVCAETSWNQTIFGQPIRLRLRSQQ